MENREPKFEIGTVFKTRGKCPKLCKVVDIYKTFNSSGELVRLEYKTEHEFMGQKISDYVPETTIAMGLLNGN